jgi:hypothetical protein
MRIFAALAAVFFIAGCGTLATGGGKTQNVRFNSYPSGADVSVDGNGIGKTPTSANLTRTDDHAVRFDMAGYPSRIVLLKHGPNLSMLGNFIFPGPPGFLVDAMSGAGKGELKPSVVNVTMEPARTTDSAEPATAP